jgi:hypothetical protein
MRLSLDSEKASPAAPGPATLVALSQPWGRCLCSSLREVRRMN